MAVHKAVNEGRISTIKDKDGVEKIDAAVADIQWERNTRARISPQAAAGNGSADQPGLVADLVSQAGVDTPSATGGTGSAAEGSGQVDKGYANARARREQAEAELAEIEAATARGSMVMREDVDRAMYEIGREMRDRLASCAKRVAAEVSSLASAEGCEEVIEREHRIVLELLVTSFREKVGTAPKSAS